LCFRSVLDNNPVTESCQVSLCVFRAPFNLAIEQVEGAFFCRGTEVEKIKNI
jgi:hypothetical protein